MLGLAVVPGLARAEEPKPLGAVAALVGQGTITHAAAQAERTPAQVSDAVFQRDKIQTATSSVMRVLMGGRITITIRERSIVVITDDPMRPRVDLESGNLALKVHEGGLRAGEIAELRTPNSITGIRGSLVIARVDGTDSFLTVLDAHKPITIAPRNNPAQTTPLPIGHTVRVSGPPHAPRVGKVAPAAKEHLEKAAAVAEVPGRPKDGGQERIFKLPAKATAKPAAVEGPAAATPSRVPALGERKIEAPALSDRKIETPALAERKLQAPAAVQVPAAVERKADVPAAKQLKKVDEPDSAVAQPPPSARRLLAPR